MQMRVRTSTDTMLLTDMARGRWRLAAGRHRRALHVPRHAMRQRSHVVLRGRSGASSETTQCL